MKNNISISDFEFIFKGHGHYKVTYWSPKTNNSWSALITNMTIIDKTKNEEYPKKVDLNQLKRLCKANY